MPDSAHLQGVSRELAEQLNRECFCVSLDRIALEAALGAEAGEADLAGSIAQRPHLFSQAPVFLSESDGAAMRAVVAAIEAASELAGYREAVLDWAPEVAALDFGPRGAFMGYDFHVGDEGPKLIEVNTNAGGAVLNAFLARAQIACCAEVERALARESLARFETAVTAMFEAEWRAQRGDRPLRRIAIVDDAPDSQYLYPEFVLAKRLFESQGYEAAIVDARDLRYESGVLRAGAHAIDLVYNRLVDFALEAPEHAPLRAAYVEGAAVLTPNPRNHALFADKRNLTVLSDREALAAWGLGAEHLRALQAAPQARRVRAADAEALWGERRRWFFKPARGHGGKAVYRGDKLTKAAWAEILGGDYIAQELVRPGERTIVVDGERVQRKLDVRLYTYAGEVLLAAARLYQGQTTNFRTPGGGFAPVFSI